MNWKAQTITKKVTLKGEQGAAGEGEGMREGLLLIKNYQGK